MAGGELDRRARTLIALGAEYGATHPTARASLVRYSADYQARGLVMMAELTEGGLVALADAARTSVSEAARRVVTQTLEARDTRQHTPVTLAVMATVVVNPGTPQGRVAAADLAWRKSKGLCVEGLFTVTVAVVQRLCQHRRVAPRELIDQLGAGTVPGQPPGR